MASSRRNAGARSADQRMDGAASGRQQEKGSVLLNTDSLSSAIKTSTQGGRRKIDGLYMSDGSKVEQTVDSRTSESKAGNAEAKANLALSKVAQEHTNRQQRKLKLAERKKMSEEEYRDMETAKKAAKVRENSTDLEHIMYKELFSFFDVDKDKTWGSIEFAQRMTDIGMATTVEEASNLLYFAGVQDVDRITYDDFLLLMPKLKAFRKVLERDAMRAFASKDTRGRGWITCKAAKEVFISISGPEGYDEEDITRMVRTADRERTGMITFDFFIRALFGTPPVLVYKPPSRAASLMSRLCFCGSGGRGDSDSDGEGDHQV